MTALFNRRAASRFGARPARFRALALLALLLAATVPAVAAVEGWAIDKAIEQPVQ